MSSLTCCNHKLLCSFVSYTYCGVAGITNVKKRQFGGVRWIMLIVAGTVLNAVLLTVLTQACISATCGLRHCISVILLITVTFRSDVKKVMNFLGSVFRNTSRSVRDVCDAILLCVSQTNAHAVTNVSFVIS